MAITDINTEDRLVQQTVANFLRDELGWESVYAWNEETFGPSGTLGRTDTREAVLRRDLRKALQALNPELPASAVEHAIAQLTVVDFSRSTVQHNREFNKLIRNGVPVSFRDSHGNLRNVQAKVIDFLNPANNRFVAVRELKLTGLRAPQYNRRADIVCFVNGLPLVFIELKAVYKNIRAGFDGNLSDYMDEHVIAHAFHHNAFLVVSNGDHAKYGSITSEWDHFSEWKRLDEKEQGALDTQILLQGMLAKDRLLDIVENFVLFDESKPGSIRKVVARNHQVLGVNQAVQSVIRQEALKRKYPADKRLKHRVVTVAAQEVMGPAQLQEEAVSPTSQMTLLESADPELGKLGVFWHTQGSGKSYSMAFFAEKVRRTVPGNFSFVIMTDRHDLDDQIYRTFVGSGIASQQTPRASSGEDLQKILSENHRYVFSLIHKFNEDVNPAKPYSARDDIIVISDEAHRTQSGRLARNMRLALPNASFIGFTGTPLFKHDQLTKRIFGDYVSRYDFKRSEQDGSTVKLVYDNRGEKLGIARVDLNDRIADAVARAELEPDQVAFLEKLLGKDYEIITADNRLDAIGRDFVNHVSTRWESGKAMLVCIDKITCARMHDRIKKNWKTRIVGLKAELTELQAKIPNSEGETKETLTRESIRLENWIDWMESTIIEIIISEGQNEVADFKKWGFDIIPHRTLMKQGFETPDGKRKDVESAFKDPDHPFRIAIVCAMWLTGFDVESLSTLYVDKPMKAHTLMQAIARPNRRFPGKDFGLIVDYNGILRSLRAAMAQYALGDGASGSEEIVAPLAERVVALESAINATEDYLATLGFDSDRLIDVQGFDRISAIADGVEAVYYSDETKRRFELFARQVFVRFKGLLMEPSALAFAQRHDNIEAIYRKLDERRDTSDVTALVKELQRIVNEAVIIAEPGEDQEDSRLYDLSKIDLEKLRDEFAKKATRKSTVIHEIRALVERKLAQMLARNPQRMDYNKKYQEILADYNHEKDRVTIEDTFAKLMAFAESLDEEMLRGVREGLSESELAIFDLASRRDLTKADRERVKDASKDLLRSLQAQLARLENWKQKEQTLAEVKVFVLDKVFAGLPTPPYSAEEKAAVAERVYQHVWSQDGIHA